MQITDELKHLIRQTVRKELQHLIQETIRKELQATGESRPKTDRCAYCEGEFPEDALNYRSGDLACKPCQVTIAGQPLRQ